MGQIVHQPVFWRNVTFFLHGIPEVLCCWRWSGHVRAGEIFFFSICVFCCCYSNIKKIIQIHSRNKWFRIILKKVNIGDVQLLQKRSKASRAQAHPRSRTSGLAEVGSCSSESTETESTLGLAVGTEQPSSQANG